MISPPSSSCKAVPRRARATGFTRRERDVLDLVVQGLPTKLIANRHFAAAPSHALLTSRPAGSPGPGSTRSHSARVSSRPATRHAYLDHASGLTSHR